MKKRLSKKTLISVCTLIAALIIWTMWSNTALMLSTVTVSSNRIPAAFNGFRIAKYPTCTMQCSEKTMQNCYKYCQNVSQT